MGNGHAVVIGASMAGLLAARALSETYREVTVLERDDLPEEAESRRGVPQSRQLHVLLARGAGVLEQLFPGFARELVEAGAVPTDPQANVPYYLDGRRLAPGPSGLTGYGISRPLMEHLVRRRVSRLPNVSIRPGVQVTGLLTAPGGSAVTGVRTDAPDTPELAADLVVDAAGRGSRALRWLRELGRPEPRGSRIRPEVVYVSRRYAYEPHHLDGRDGLGIVPFPGSPRGAVAARIEGERWAVAFLGLLGQDPTTDEDGLRAFAESLPVQDAARLIREAKPLEDPVRMRYPESVRWHLEEQTGHPDGFLVMGDALCSFNPTYGQGITVAALETLVLRQLTATGRPDLPARFYKGAAKAIDGAWAMSAGGDLRFPEIDGPRGAADRVLAGYLDRFRLAATVDPVLARTFFRVANMLDPTTAVLSPGHVVRTLRGARAARAAQR